jgi:hypothetical protein
LIPIAIIFIVAMYISNISSAHCYCAPADLVTPHSSTVGLSFLKTNVPELLRTQSSDHVRVCGQHPRRVGEAMGECGQRSRGLGRRCSSGCALVRAVVLWPAVAGADDRGGVRACGSHPCWFQVDLVESRVRRRGAMAF